jgi:hypothetical protein
VCTYVHFVDPKPLSPQIVTRSYDRTFQAENYIVANSLGRIKAARIIFHIILNALPVATPTTFEFTATTPAL